jgi:hypothetical protein
VLGAAVGSACVGDDPAPVTASEHPAGERGGSCFPNMTCNGADLKCIDGFCLLPGDSVPTTDGGTDGPGPANEASTTDTGAAADAAVDPCPPPPKHDGGIVQCNSPGSPTCQNGTICCTQSSTCTAPSQCTAVTQAAHQCESKADCSANLPECCVFSFTQVSVALDAGCPARIDSFKSTTCVTTGQCAAMKGIAVLCAAGDACPNPNSETCRGGQIELGTASSPMTKAIDVGLCVPK